jgi:hypothetical protein
MAEGKSNKVKRSVTNKSAYQTYRSSGRQEQNRALKLAKYLTTHPKDEAARAALLRLPANFINEAVKKYNLEINHNKK